MESLVAGIVGLVAIFLVSAATTLALRPSGTVECIVWSYVAGISYLLAVGYLLSFLHLFGTVWAWSATLAALLVLVAVILAGKGVRFRELRARFPKPALRGLWVETRGLVRAGRLIFDALALTVLATSLLNMIAALFATPHNIDSLNYHIARVAYYLQFQNLGHFEANFWAQVMHANGSAVVLSFIFLATNRNENAMQLLQLLSYFVSLFVVYGIARRIGGSKSTSLVAALLFGVLTEVLMEAVTTQNDLVLTACVGAGVYGLFAFRDTRQLKYVFLTILALGLGLAVKITFLTLVPSVLLIALYTLGTTKWSSVAQGMRVAGWSVLFGSGVLVLLVLPSGYAENYRAFGHPLGTEVVQELTSPLNTPVSEQIEQGGKNLVRMGLDSISLDGFPSGTAIRLIQTYVRAVPVRLVQALNLNLEEHVSFRAGFEYARLPKAHEDFSYGGILGFALIAPIVLWVLLGFSKNVGAWMLAFASLLSLLMVALTLYYEPFHGRRLIPTAFLAAPALVGFFTPLLSTHRTASSRSQLMWSVIRAYVVLIVGLGCLSAVSAILFRKNSALVPYYERSILGMNRIEQLTRAHPEYLAPLIKFEQQVPPYATVATNLNRYEYLFFGKGLTRELLPVSQALEAHRPIPARAEYLLYQDQAPSPGTADIALGADLYLRKLEKSP